MLLNLILSEVQKTIAFAAGYFISESPCGFLDRWQEIEEMTTEAMTSFVGSSCTHSDTVALDE